jgi:hypothetical protein
MKERWGKPSMYLVDCAMLWKEAMMAIRVTITILVFEFFMYLWDLRFIIGIIRIQKKPGML